MQEVSPLERQLELFFHRVSCRLWHALFTRETLVVFEHAGKILLANVGREEVFCLVRHRWEHSGHGVHKDTPVRKLQEDLVILDQLEHLSDHFQA